MAVRVSIQADQSTLNDFSAVIRRLQAETKRGGEQSVIFAALKVAESARSASKLGKTNHASVVNPEWRQAKGSFAWAKKQRRQGKEIPAEAQAALNDLNSIMPFNIVKLRQNGPAFMLGSYEKKDPRRKIQNRGLAKKTWNVMVGKLGAMKGGAGGAHDSNYRISKYNEKLGDNAGSIVVRLVNKLSYLEKAYPGITNTAIRKGTAAMVNQLDRKIAAAAARANKGKK